MNNYLNDFHDAIETGRIEKFDALMSILGDSVTRLIERQFQDDFTDNLKVLQKIVRGFGPIPHLDVEYNGTVVLDDLTDTQRAFIQGQTVAYFDIIMGMMHTRPTRYHYERAVENIGILKEIDATETVYREEMAESHNLGLISAHDYGNGRIASLTPLGRDFLAKYLLDNPPIVP